MPIRNLPLSGQQVSEDLEVCETAASRKIISAEHFLRHTVLADLTRLAPRSGRLDRARRAAVDNLKVISAIVVKRPAAAEVWITRLLAEACSQTTEQRTRGQGAIPCE